MTRLTPSELQEIVERDAFAFDVINDEDRPQASHDVRSLLRELQAVTEERDNYLQGFYSRGTEIETLRAERDAARKNEARYLLLRNDHDDFSVKIIRQTSWEHIYEEELDAAIDSALTPKCEVCIDGKALNATGTAVNFELNVVPCPRCVEGKDNG